MQRAVFAAVAITLVAWTVGMCLLEPVLLDGHFVTRWLAEGGSFADYVRANWMGELTWGNPRVGQWATYVTYGQWHAVVTPLFVASLFGLMLVHVRGRWPDPARDGWMLLVLVGLAVLAQPQIGPVLFYRPFTANYVVGLVVQLCWLVPYRFAVDRSRRAPQGNAILRSAGMLVLGALAGACNEHTGPALVVAVGLACVWLAKQRRLRAWHVVGLVAFVAGYFLMMTAPAQAVRYCGVGEGSLVERLAGRSIVGTLWIVLGLVIAGRWMWVAAGVAAIVARTKPSREALLWIALGAAISLTLLLSPKQGGRLIFAGLVFASLGVAVMLEAWAEARPRLRTAITIVAIGTVGFAVGRTLLAGARVAADDAARRVVLSAAQPGTIVTVPAMREPPSRWFLGDDFAQDSLRHQIAQRRGLTAIDVEGRPMIPYQFAIRVDDQRVERFVSLNQCEARRTFGDEVRAKKPQHAELAVMPREPIWRTPLASSRWRAGKLVAPSASVVNELGTRYLTLDRGGLEGPVTVTLIGPGKQLVLVEEAGRYPYKPWQNGPYWAVVCAGDDCYLASAIRHTGL